MATSQMLVKFGWGTYLNLIYQWATIFGNVFLFYFLNAVADLVPGWWVVEVSSTVAEGDNKGRFSAIFFFLALKEG